MGSVAPTHRLKYSKSVHRLLCAQTPWLGLYSKLQLQYTDTYPLYILLLCRSWEYYMRDACPLFVSLYTTIVAQSPRGDRICIIQ